MTWSDSLGRLAAQLAAHKPSLYPTEELDDLMDIRIGKQRTDGFEGERLHAALAVKAGLYLFNESLEPSQAISQELHTREGSYLHGMMRRMEGDYPEAAYWFEMAGGHPAGSTWAASIGERLKEHEMLERINGKAFRDAAINWLNDGSFDVLGFNALVELQVTQTRDAAAEEWLKELQWEELRTLVNHCFQMSGGEGELV